MTHAQKPLPESRKNFLQKQHTTVRHWIPPIIGVIAGTTIGAVASTFVHRTPPSAPIHTEQSNSVAAAPIAAPTYFATSESSSTPNSEPSLLNPTNPVTSTVSSTAIATAYLTKAISQLSDQATYAGLPVDSVTYHPATSSQATVILLPQSHRYPGSSPSDGINDTAEVAQNQLYSILSFLNKKFDLQLVMAEGDPFGPVAPRKLELISEKIQQEKSFTALLTALEQTLDSNHFGANFISTLHNEGTNILQGVDRAITLQGAPYKLKAEGVPLTLYGSEDMDTIKQGTVLVRNYIYLQDRLSQIAPHDTRLTATSLPQSFSINDLSTLISPPNPVQTFMNSLALLEQSASTAHQSNITALAQQTAQSLQSLITDPDYTSTSDSENAPSRSDNPYASVSSQQVLDADLDQVESTMQKVVVDKRNAEAAANMAAMLGTEHATVGILQFGADHEPGLIRDLNAQHISVIVITPQAVAAESKAGK